MSLSKGTKIGGGLGVGVIVAAVLGYFQLQTVIDENTTTQTELTGAIAQEIDPVKAQQERYQRRFDLEDYSFYRDKICVKSFPLSRDEQDKLIDILFRLNYPPINCER